jgi:hypothetical protein
VEIGLSQQQEVKTKALPQMAVPALLDLVWKIKLNGSRHSILEEKR